MNEVEKNEEKKQTPLDWENYINSEKVNTDNPIDKTEAFNSSYNSEKSTPYLGPSKSAMLDILSKRKQKQPISTYNSSTNNQFKNFNFVSSNEDSSLSIHNDFESYNQNANNTGNSNNIYGYNNIGGRFFPSLMNFNKKNNNFNLLRKSNFSIPLPQRNPKTPNLQPIINKTLSNNHKLMSLPNENLNNNYFEMNHYPPQISPYPNNNNTIYNKNKTSYGEMDTYEYNPPINYTTSTYKPITVSSPKRNQITISNKYPGLALQQNLNNLNISGGNDTSQLFATNSPPSSLDNTLNFPMSVLPKYPSLSRNNTPFQIPQSVNKNRIIPNPNELINQKRRRDLSPFGVGGGQSYFYNLSSKNKSINPPINNWNQYVNGLSSPQSNQMSPSGQYEGLNFDDFEEFNMLTENENYKQEKEEPFQNDKRYSSKIIICEKEGKTSIKAVEAEEIDNNNNIQNNKSLLEISKPQADNSIPLLNTGNNNLTKQEDYTNQINLQKTNNMNNNIEDVNVYIDQHSNHSNSSGFDIDNTKKYENKKSPSSRKPQNDNSKNKKKVQKQSQKRKEKKNAIN